jgi:hypothetical protein
MGERSRRGKREETERISQPSAQNDLSVARDTVASTVKYVAIEYTHSVFYKDAQAIERLGRQLDDASQILERVDRIANRRDTEVKIKGVRIKPPTRPWKNHFRKI